MLRAFPDHPAAFLLVAFWLLAGCLMLPQVHGHGAGGPFAAEIEAVATSAEWDGEEIVPWEDARLFAWRLIQHGVYLMSPEQMRAARRAHALLEAAGDMTSEVPDADARRARLLRAGQEGLVELLESLKAVQHVRVEGEHTVSESRFAFDLPGTSGTLLFRLDNGPDTTAFITVPWTATALDLSTIPEPQQALELEYLPGGVTWVMLRVKYAPPDEMSVFIDAKPRAMEGPAARFLTHLRAGPMGELTLDIIDADGASVPALVNLIHRSTGALYQPSGAIEFAPMMFDISGEPVLSPARPFPGAGEPFVHTIPGEEGGFYWLVGAESTMAIPAGEWEVRVWKGPEYLSQRQRFEVSAGERTDVSVRMERWVNMAARGWWSGDTHIHSRLISDRDADRLMTFMEASDLHVGNVVRMGNYARTYFEQRGFGPEYRVQRGNRVLVPGQEDPRGFHGHSLALNIDRPVRDQSKYLLTDWAARETAAAGGIYGNAHVMYNGFNVRRDMTMLMPQDLTHFGEVLQIGLLGTELYYDFLNMGFKMAAAAGSDVPFGHAFGEVRYYVHTGEETLDVDAWFAAMKAGRTFVSNGPMLEFSVNGQGPGADLMVGEDAILRISARAESAPTRGKALQSLAIHRHGEVIREVAGDGQLHELTIDLEIPAGFGGWITAHAVNMDGTVALTSPVYVTREGFRRWKHDEMPELFAKAHATLDGMEREILDRIREWEAEEVPWWNMYVRAMAEMGPTQLERIEEVRGMYAELEEIWKREREARLAEGRSP